MLLPEAGSPKTEVALGVASGEACVTMVEHAMNLERPSLRALVASTAARVELLERALPITGRIGGAEDGRGRGGGNIGTGTGAGLGAAAFFAAAEVAVDIAVAASGPQKN